MYLNRKVSGCSCTSGVTFPAEVLISPVASMSNLIPSCGYRDSSPYDNVAGVKPTTHLWVKNALMFTSTPSIRLYGVLLRRMDSRIFYLWIYGVMFVALGTEALCYRASSFHSRLIIVDVLARLRSKFSITEVIRRDLQFGNHGCVWIVRSKNALSMSGILTVCKHAMTTLPT
jgi:hypothetical protein